MKTVLIRHHTTRELILVHNAYNNTFVETLLFAIAADIELKGADMCKENLSGIDLKGGKLTFCDFRETDLSNTKFSNASLNGSNFTGAKFIGKNADGTEETLVVKDATVIESLGEAERDLLVFITDKGRYFSSGDTLCLIESEFMKSILEKPEEETNAKDLEDYLDAVEYLDAFHPFPPK